MNNTQILIVDDHSLLRQALKVFIQLERPNYSVEEASNGEHAIQRIIKKEYDILVTDINMPRMSGYELVKTIKARNNNIKILTISMLLDHKTVSSMLELGVDGYVSKFASNHELLKAIDEILNGNTYYSSDVASVFMSGFQHKKESDQIIESLSKRELEILYLVLKEYSNQEIAEKLYISPRTVETHKYKLLQKTNSKNIAGLFKFAILNELFGDLL